MEKENLKQWSGEFGDAYTERNNKTVSQMERMYFDNYGITRTGMNRQFINSLDRDISILEVGCNIGNQLICLQKMGFRNLYGIEPNKSALEIARQRTKHINLIEASGLSIPFEPSSFQLVFTSGVLIHVPPSDLNKFMEEVHRVTALYIWGFEYFAPNHESVPYREHEDMMWRGNFAQMYREKFPDLSIVHAKFYRYKHERNINQMFLIKL